MELLLDTNFSPNNTTLNEQESHHCINVLRHQIGDEINITDGKGSLYRCTIESTTKKNLVAHINQTLVSEPPLPVHICVALTKNIERYEWFAEKAIEIGATAITPLICTRSERRKINLERLQRIVISAAKQSTKLYLPQVNEPVKFADILKNKQEDIRVILHTYPTKKDHLFNVIERGKSVMCLIGPEGDFSEEEVQQAKENGFRDATLGEEILRVETAAVVTTNIIKLKNQV